MNKFIRSKWFSFALVLQFILGIVAGNIVWRVNYLINHVTEGQQKEYHTNRPLSVLILGSDKRGSYGGDLTDVMMLAVFNPLEKKVRLLSIPRDTRVIIPGEKLDRKINSVMKRGEELKEEALGKGETPTTDGISLLKETIESIYGIPVQNYVMINFDSFRQTIDELGGIEVDVDKRLLYHDPTDGTAIDLQPGLQTLNGEQALGFVRHRHDDRGIDYFSTDYDRNARQQVVIHGVLNQLKTFSGMTKIFNILNVIGENIKTDLSVNQMRGLFGDFSKMDSNNIISLTHEGVYWVSEISRTLIPLETLEKIRSVLLEAMNLKEKVVFRYNDSPAGIGLERKPPGDGKQQHMDMNEDDSEAAPAPDEENSNEKPNSENPGNEKNSGLTPGTPIIGGGSPDTDKEEPPQPSTPPKEEENPKGSDQGSIQDWIPFGR
ncbi:MAG TPA: hypothetical protein DDY49_09285 [Paenibacillaceae bacterium]|nr:hypothetical protein [Paenibacillaceae bacterium]